MKKSVIYLQFSLSLSLSLIPSIFIIVNLYPNGINMNTIINILKFNVKIKVKYICNGVGGYSFRRNIWQMEFLVYWYVNCFLVKDAWSKKTSVPTE
jgi:hypothetical protein